MTSMNKGLKPLAPTERRFRSVLRKFYKGYIGFAPGPLAILAGCPSLAQWRVGGMGRLFAIGLLLPLLPAGLDLASPI